MQILLIQVKGSSHMFSSLKIMWPWCHKQQDCKSWSSEQQQQQQKAKPFKYECSQDFNCKISYCFQISRKFLNKKLCQNVQGSNWRILKGNTYYFFYRGSNLKDRQVPAEVTVQLVTLLVSMEATSDIQVAIIHIFQLIVAVWHETRDHRSLTLTWIPSQKKQKQERGTDFLWVSTPAKLLKIIVNFKQLQINS